MIDPGMKLERRILTQLDISELIQVHSIGHRLKDVKVNFNHDIKIDAPEASIDAKHGEILSISRWIAEALSSENLVNVQDTDMIVALKQMVAKENVQGISDLSTLESDFYIKMNSFMQLLPQQNRDKVESMLNTLLRKRLGKIINLAGSPKMTHELASKLTIEERALLDYIHSRSNEFTKQIIGAKR